jgi:glycolate oxidase FAD binding subunit
VRISDLPVTTRAAEPHLDAIDDVVPAVVAEPATPAEVAMVLAWAAERRLSVVLQGAGTKRRWGRTPARIDLLVDMRRLNHLIDHRAGDLTVTVEAGMSLSALNAVLGSAGQHLPLDPACADRATIGGLLATNDSGPSRYRHGAPRDLIIGVQLATVDGKLTKAGGQVVKNVAGYDLSKLACGSFGTLAAIVSATFKVSPLPMASRTLAIDARDAARLARLTQAIGDSQLEPLAFEIYVRRSVSGLPDVTGCLLRFASVPAAVEAQAEEAAARALALGAVIDTIEGGGESALWRDHVLDAADSGSCVVRASWLPADVPALVGLIETLGADAGVELVGRAGVGAGQIRIAGDAARQARAIALLRQSPAVGNVVITSGSTELKGVVDVWGPAVNARMFQAVKRALDANDTLGAGRASW